MRKQPESGTLPAVPEQKVEIDFDAGLHETFTALRDSITDGERILMPPGERRDAVVGEMHALAEFAYYLGARVVSPEEMDAKGLTFELLTAEEMATPVAEEARTETLALMEDMESRGFRIPEKAKAAVRDGQTSLLSSAKPPHSPPRMPYKDEPDEEPLPDPERNEIGRFSDPAVSGAPETQRAAAVLAYYKTGSQRLAVLDAIGESGEHGMTDHEIETGLRMRHQTASARRNDLMNDGWITDSSVRRRTDTGRPAVVWVLSDAGKSQWMGRLGA